MYVYAAADLLRRWYIGEKHIDDENQRIIIDTLKFVCAERARRTKA